MVAAAELHPKRHRYPGDVAPAEDGVPSRQRHQLAERIGLSLGRIPHLALPVLVDRLAPDLVQLASVPAETEALMSSLSDSSMKLPKAGHASRPWRIHEICPDFRLEDVWALPTTGGPDDFSRLVRLIASSDPTHDSPRAARVLWAIRWKVGELFGWDDPGAGTASRVPTLLDRLPADLRDAARPEFDELPFSSLYMTRDEFAAEVANRTVHAVMHLGWVPDGAGGYRGQMAVLVKPNGLFGNAYMAAIRPFRHLVVYPAALGLLEREWRADAAPASVAAADG